MMRKFIRPLAVVACTAALCGTLTGCRTVDKSYTENNETHGETVYVYLPNGFLLARGTPDGIYNSTYNDTVTVRINGKEYHTNWSNVVLVEE